MTTDEMIEVMARAIHGADKPAGREAILFEYCWVEDMRLAQARAALAAILPVMREDIAAAVMAAPTEGRTRRVRARFDQIAKEVAG